jgi:molybdopterin molybdotransferase
MRRAGQNATFYNPPMSTAFEAAPLLSYRQAAEIVQARAAQWAAPLPAVERVALHESANRVLATAVCADRDQPPFARSTRDGFACRAGEASAHGWLDVAGATRAGQAAGKALPAGAAWEIMTGAPVPEDADAVMMIEHVQAADGRVRLLPPRTMTVGENVVARAAQARAGDQLLPAGMLVNFAQIAVAAECGFSSLEVFKQPRVAILTTGDELVAVDAAPAEGQIRNSNAPMLAALVAAAGGQPWVLPAALDNAASLDAALADAAEADMLLISGGVSAGKFDLVEPALARRGARFHFTGVRIQPGKPLVFGELPGRAGRPVPLFGLPGNPVSSAATFLIFGAPLLAVLSGRPWIGPRFALARMAAATGWRGKPGLTRFLPARCTHGAAAGEVPEAELISWHGSGDLAALARSNCFLVIPEEASELPAGETVTILPF